MKEIKKILCAVDLSEHSAAVAEYATMLAKGLGASIIVVYTAPSLSQYVGFHVPPNTIENFVGEIVSGAEKSMDAFVAENFPGVEAKGQVLIGCLASTTCMICLGGKMPNWLLLVVMTVASLAAGALWGFLPGFFKAKWNTNETLFTLMMNYIATQLVAYFIIIWEVPKGSGKIGIINQDTQAGWLPTIGNQKYLLAILVVAILTGLMYIYLNYSKHGYEIAVVGESRRTASYAGIKVDRVIIRTMALSGALCGLIGLLLTSSTDHTMTTTIVDGRGFTAVMVSWMAKFNPVIMIFVSLLLVVLSRGASEISTAFGLNRSFSDILTGILLFFIIGCEFFINYKIQFRSSGKKEA